MKIKEVKINFKKECKKQKKKLNNNFGLWSQQRFYLLYEILKNNIDFSKTFCIYTSADLMTIFSTMSFGENRFITRDEHNPTTNFVFNFDNDKKIAGFIDLYSLNDKGENDEFIMIRYTDGNATLINFNADDFFTEVEEI